ncbi:MAG TPA: hypothetical protein VH575_31335 [Gemmataceae bacterium]
MGRKLRHVGWITLFLVAFVGCTKSAVRTKEVPDPMLVTKPPVEGRSHTSKSSPLSRGEPTPPPLPAGVDSPTSVRGDRAAPVQPTRLLSPNPE